MYNRDYADLIGGVVLMGVGLFVALYAYANYRLGTINNMGPGMVPLGLGCIIAGLGTITAVSAMFRTGQLPKVAVRPLLSVVIGLAAFALIVEPLGLVPAIFALVCISASSHEDSRWRTTLVLCLGLSIIVSGIFVFGLGVPLRLFAWRF